jgi:flagellar motility protein MotE (MotC chaperone)
VLLVAVALFSAAAAGSWFLQQKIRADAATREPKNGSDKEPTGNSGTPSRSSAGDGGLSKPGIRPKTPPDPKSVAEMAANVQQQLDSLKTREQELTVRQKSLELIAIDIRSGQKPLDDLRKQIGEELKILLEKLGEFEKRSADVKLQSQKLVDRSNELKASFAEVDKVEQARLKQAGPLYDAMEPDAAAQTLQDMVEKGKLDTAVKILSSMQPAKAAKVLATLSSTPAPVATQIVERFMALKLPTAKAP